MSVPPSCLPFLPLRCADPCADHCKQRGSGGPRGCGEAVGTGQPGPGLPARLQGVRRNPSLAHPWRTSGAPLRASAHPWCTLAHPWRTPGTPLAHPPWQTAGTPLPPSWHTPLVHPWHTPLTHPLLLSCFSFGAGEYVDMVKAGIIDPVKVIRTALVDAARCASVTAMYCISQNSTVQYCTVRYCTVLYCTVQYCMEVPVPYGLYSEVACTTLCWAFFMTTTEAVIVESPEHKQGVTVSPCRVTVSSCHLHGVLFCPCFFFFPQRVLSHDHNGSRHGGVAIGQARCHCIIVPCHSISVCACSCCFQRVFSHDHNGSCHRGDRQRTRRRAPRDGGHGGHGRNGGWTTKGPLGGGPPNSTTQSSTVVNHTRVRCH